MNTTPEGQQQRSKRFNTQSQRGKENIIGSILPFTSLEAHQFDWQDATPGEK
jgi:hypothetical protein